MKQLRGVVRDAWAKSSIRSTGFDDAQSFLWSGLDGLCIVGDPVALLAVFLSLLQSIMSVVGQACRHDRHFWLGRHNVPSHDPWSVESTQNPLPTRSRILEAPACTSLLPPPFYPSRRIEIRDG